MGPTLSDFAGLVDWNIVISVTMHYLSISFVLFVWIAYRGIESADFKQFDEFNIACCKHFILPLIISMLWPIAVIYGIRVIVCRLIQWFCVWYLSKRT